MGLSWHGAAGRVREGQCSRSRAQRRCNIPPALDDGETMSTFQSQPSSGNAVGRLLRFTWRYKLLIAAAVLLGALLGYGWAARQPTLYQGVARVILVVGSDRTALPGEAPYPPGDPESYLRSQAQLMSSSPVLERAVTLSGSRISAETLRQRLEVEV